jgi:1-deoxy-D-xylulose-5-phosphate reductoisomerase
MRTCRVIILGSTGSIGTQTLEVIRHLNALAESALSDRRFEVVGLAAGSSGDELFAQARATGVRELALASGSGAYDGVRVRLGQHAAEELVREVECDLVVAAIVGFAGVRATLAAAEIGRDIALANKESLVAAGALVVQAARASGSRLLPIDSEHSGLWQCLGGVALPWLAPPAIRRMVITASGGPFRDRRLDEIFDAAPAEALEHPTWDMGPKVTIDSATLMNKALEIIEAHWLFGLDGDRIEAMIHPQSVIHAMVEHEDGSVIAQLGAPDMRTAIQHALSHPARTDGCSKRLTIADLARLELAPVDRARFPAIDIAYRALHLGGTAGAILNAVNEEAVRAYLDGRIRFGEITELVEEGLASLPTDPVRTLRDAVSADARARAWALDRLDARASAR